jgi:hypothetical protein
MYHIAIMNPSWKMIPKIVSGEKSIESRWYQTRRTPWNKITSGDTVFFKDSGKAVTAKAKVEKVLQFSLDSVHDAQQIVAKYGKRICLVHPHPKKWDKLPRYCILIFLRDAQYLDQPFFVNKKGFGAGAAWLTFSQMKSVIQDQAKTPSS